MRRKDFSGPGREPPVLLVKWYDFTRWLLERIDSFPKNQRFIFGTRLADHALGVLETLVEAAYSRRKVDLLAGANRKIEMLRWLVRLATDRKVMTEKQYLFACASALCRWANNLRVVVVSSESERRDRGNVRTSH